MTDGTAVTSTMDLMASLFDARDEADFSARLQAAAKQSGFETYLLGVEWRSSVGKVQHHVTSGYSLPWQTTYAERQYIARDPTVAHCQTNTSPLVWSEQAFRAAGAMDLLEEARSHGLGSGISVPVHDRNGIKSMLSLARDQGFQSDPRETAALLASARVLASCVHVAMRTVLAPSTLDAGQPRLTPKERVALGHVANGKTADVIAQIMGVSESTVIFHLGNVMRKLEVANRPQMVAAAFRWGLIY